MGRNQGVLSLSERSAWIQLLVSLFYIIVIGGGILILLIIPGYFIFSPADDLWNDDSLVPAINDVGFLIYSIMSQHIAVFIIPGLILFKMLNQTGKESHPEFGNPGWSSIWSVMILTICIMPLAGLSNELTMLIKFPEWLSGFEKWIEEKEMFSDRLFDSFFIYKSLLLVILNILMIIILPGIGEELVFRGVIQPVIGRLFRSEYSGVLITSFLFSAVHLQLNGFMPRFILGIVCGLLFLWTGKLWLSVIFHAMNNSLAMIGEYTVDVSSGVSPEPGYIIAGRVIVMLLLLIPAVKILGNLRKQYLPVQRADLQVENHDPQV